MEEQIITIEEFINTYKPKACNKCREEKSLLDKYINSIKTLHELRLEPEYSMHIWTEINNEYIISGKAYQNEGLISTGIIFCEIEHDIEIKIKVIK